MKDDVLQFRLYDFLAYIFPGVATLHVLYLFSKDTISQSTELLSDSAVVNGILMVAISYAIGLFWSAISRDIIRPLLWKIANPRIDLLFTKKERQTLLSPAVRDTAKAELQAMLDTECPSEKDVSAICRSYVALHCPAAWARRENVSCVRAMAANLIGPIGLYAAYLFTHEYLLLGFLAVFIAIALLRKIFTHESIEWRELYISFIVHRKTSDPFPAPED